MRVREVPAGDVPHVMGEDWVDRQRKPYVRSGRAFIPVKEGYPCTSEIPERRRYGGCGYYMVGPVAVIQGRRPTPGEVDSLMNWKKPRGIIWIKSYQGAERIPDTEILAGSPGEVVHREGGISYRLDPARLMFSMGNRGEKERMAGIVREGEFVADMFAGIGYFTLPVARQGARVDAMEINPLAFSFLTRNIPENGVSDRVTPRLGDCRDLLRGRYDRIIMGHFDAPRYLSCALRHVKPGTTIHVHSAGEAIRQIQGVLEEEGFFAVITSRRVKKIGARMWHYVQDVTIR